MFAAVEGLQLNEATIAAIGIVIGIAFGAGGYAVLLRTQTKQINGLGQRLNRAVGALIHICPEEKREEVTRMIFGLKKE